MFDANACQQYYRLFYLQNWTMNCDVCKSYADDKRTYEFRLTEVSVEGIDVSVMQMSFMEKRNRLRYWWVTIRPHELWRCGTVQDYSTLPWGGMRHADPTPWSKVGAMSSTEHATLCVQQCNWLNMAKCTAIFPKYSLYAKQWLTRASSWFLRRGQRSIFVYPGGQRTGFGIVNDQKRNTWRATGVSWPSLLLTPLMIYIFFKQQTFCSVWVSLTPPPPFVHLQFYTDTI